MLLNLIKPKDIPSVGKHLGTFLDVGRQSKDADGNENDQLVVKVELDTLNKAGQKHVLEKTYNLGPHGRGLATFREDYKSWSGRRLTDQELVAFDADKLMKGHRVTVAVKHKKDGKETIAAIDAFLPVPAATPASIS